MDLIVSPTSPFARKVQILAHEQGLASAITLRKLHPLDDAAELMAINPLGRVPALITDDQQLVVDSPVICALGYLDFRHGTMQWRDGRPALAAWFAQWENRDSYRLTQPPG